MSKIKTSVRSIGNLSGESGPYLKVVVSFIEPLKLRDLNYTHGAEVTTFVEKKDQSLSELEAEAKASAVEVLKRLIEGQE